jgi:hypothetical protein
VPNHFSATSFGTGAMFIALPVAFKIKEGATAQLPLWDSIIMHIHYTLVATITYHKIKKSMPNMNRLNKPTQKNRYQTVLRELVIFVDNIKYAKDHEFQMAQLAELIPQDICRRMCMKAFMNADPGPEDNSIHGRSLSLMYSKKALSYFMPNWLMAWNELSLAGNPTRSVAFNNLIKAVKKKEVWKQGQASKAD